MSLSTEQHLLQKVSEECVEVSKEVSKAILFGLHNHGPKEDKSNKEKIQDELADLLAVVEMACERGILDNYEIFNREKIEVHKDKVMEFAEYSQSQGITEYFI